MAAHLPDVTIAPFHIEQPELEESRPETYWYSRLGVHPEQEPTFIVLPDPFMIDPRRLLDVFNQAFPLRPVVGGLASGGQSRNSCALFLNGEVVHGAVGVALWGNLLLHTVVSQGCKPIGQAQIITRCEDQVIYELGGRGARVVRNRHCLAARRSGTGAYRMLMDGSSMSIKTISSAVIFDPDLYGG
jgi:small ligand-binding sensory domain FIST